MSLPNSPLSHNTGLGNCLPGFCRVLCKQAGRGIRSRGEILVSSSVSACGAADVQLLNCSQAEKGSRCSLQDPDVPLEEAVAPECSLMTLLICWEWGSHDSLRLFKASINQTLSDHLVRLLK